MTNSDTASFIKAYYSGRQLSDSLLKTIDSTLHAHKMYSYHFLPLRVNLTKSEVNQLSAEMTRKIIDEMHLQEVKEQLRILNRGDTLPFTQIFKETKIAFPFIDTISHGWMMYPDTSHIIDTLPIVFYKTLSPVDNEKTAQLYHYLRERFARDTVVLIEK